MAKDKDAGVSSGLAYKETIPKGYTPRGEGEGQRPNSKGTTVKGSK